MIFALRTLWRTKKGQFERGKDKMAQLKLAK